MRVEKDYNLLPHNTFGIKASCKEYLEYASVDEAFEVASRLRDATAPYIIIGGGSNLLLTSDYPGIVVRSVVKGIKVVNSADGHVLVSVGSGEKWDDFVAYSIRCGWHGAENLSLIPGDVGASAVQNIGAYGVEACDLIEKVVAVDILSGQLTELMASDCAYGYRKSRFKEEWKNRYLIVQVVYKLSLSFTPLLNYGNIRAELERRNISEPMPEILRNVIIDIRKSKLPDPEIVGNAGSFFMNPVVDRDQFESLLVLNPQMPHYPVDEHHEKIPAGWLIEQCGWKGKSLGNAGVHEKQALVLVNCGGASGKEILALSDAIRQDVSERFGIDIQPEVNIV